LTPFLAAVQERYHRREWLGSDPIEFVLTFSDPWDQEAVALVAAQLAYGNVKQIRRGIGDWLERILRVSRSPAEWVRAGVWSRSGESALEGFVHRLHRGTELLELSRLQSRSWRLWGSLGAHLVSGLRPGDEHFGGALDAVLDQWQRWYREDSGGLPPSRALQHLLSAPAQGSCCKRWCMLLRWMGRHDELDPGLWTAGSPLLSGLGEPLRGLSAAQLVMPLDTHVGRICRYLGLTRRKTLNWKAALEVTRSLRQVDASDPVRYDFALARLGILDLCRNRYVSGICENCGLFGPCRVGRPRGEGRLRQPLRATKSSRGNPS
jgi:uncharacterized protein (TIGR02757 family)